MGSVQVLARPPQRRLPGLGEMLASLNSTDEPPPVLGSARRIARRTHPPSVSPAASDPHSHGPRRLPSLPSQRTRSTSGTGSVPGPSAPAPRRFLQPVPATSRQLRQTQAPSPRRLGAPGPALMRHSLRPSEGLLSSPGRRNVDPEGRIDRPIRRYDTVGRARRPLRARVRRVAASSIAATRRLQPTATGHLAASRPPARSASGATPPDRSAPPASRSLRVIAGPHDRHGLLHAGLMQSPRVGVPRPRSRAAPSRSGPSARRSVRRVAPVQLALGEFSGPSVRVGAPAPNPNPRRRRADHRIR